MRSSPTRSISPEHARLGHAHRPAPDRVRLLDGEPLVHRGVHRHLQPVGADPVGDETGRIVRADHRLAQHPVAEITDLGGDHRIGRRSGDELEQPHVARRIEEVRDEGNPPRSLRAALRPTSRAGLSTCWTTPPCPAGARVQLAVQILLEIEPLDDRLDHPVAFRDAAEMILDIPRLDQLRRALRHERRGIGLQQLRHRPLRHRHRGSQGRARYRAAARARPHWPPARRFPRPSRPRR